MPAHHNNENNFYELSYSQQASSLTSQINNLKKEILAHKKTAEQLGKEDSTYKFIEQLEQMISELRAN